MESHSIHAKNLNRRPLSPGLLLVSAACVLSVLQRIYAEGPGSYRASTAVHVFGILGPVLCFLIPALVPAFLVSVLAFHVTDVIAFDSPLQSLNNSR